jgi:hypothetical protein
VQSNDCAYRYPIQSDLLHHTEKIHPSGNRAAKQLIFCSEFRSAVLRQDRLSQIKSRSNYRGFSPDPFGRAEKGGRARDVGRGRGLEGHVGERGGAVLLPCRHESAQVLDGQLLMPRLSRRLPCRVRLPPATRPWGPDARVFGCFDGLASVEASHGGSSQHRIAGAECAMLRDYSAASTSRNGNLCFFAERKKKRFTHGRGVFALGCIFSYFSKMTLNIL